ncbi:MAG: hypothetical protein RLZZ34_1268, partial [Verrucomicrobiota bacterium]
MIVVDLKRAVSALTSQCESLPRWLPFREL